MKKLLLLSFLIIGLSASAKADGIFGGGSSGLPEGDQTVTDHWTFQSTVTIGRMSLGVTEHFVPAGASVANYTVVSTSTYHRVNCADTDGCLIITSESGASIGDVIYYSNNNDSLGIATWDHSDSQQDLGGTDIALGVGDTLGLIYIGHAWARFAYFNN